MAKLYFYYAAMNAGKSTTLLQADFNYRERGMETMLWTAKLDQRAGAGVIGSRIALSAPAHSYNDDVDLFAAVGDELAGMSSFLGIDEARQVLEIGGTYYRPKFRGTGFNRRVKDMMLQRAFASGIRRVEFRVDRRNARSQAAMKKLGAVREGVLRADRITWNGHVRDTVLFAILKDEWPI